MYSDGGGGNTWSTYSNRDRAPLRVIEYFVKSPKVTRNNTVE